MDMANRPNELVAVYDGPCEFADHLERIPKAYWRIRRYGNYDYHKDYLRGVEKLRKGDISISEQAEKLIAQFEAEHVLSMGVLQPHTSIIGGYTVTPLFNAGIPECMLTLDNSHLRGANAPLNIYFDRYGSIGLDTEKALNRGLACVAFVVAMSQIRPINLYMIAVTSPLNYGLYGALIRVHTNPLDLARAGWIMTNAIFYETLTWSNMSYQYHKCNKSLDTGHYENAMGPYGGRIHNVELASAYRVSFDCGPDDIILYGTQTTAPRTHDENAADDPIGWVKAMLKLHAYRQENE